MPIATTAVMIEKPDRIRRAMGRDRSVSMRNRLPSRKRLSFGGSAARWLSVTLPSPTSETVPGSGLRWSRPRLPMLQGGVGATGEAWLAEAPPHQGGGPEAHTEESGDRRRRERQATGTRQSGGGSRNRSRRLRQSGPPALLHLLHDLGAASLGPGLGQGEADTRGGGLLPEGQAGDCRD